ncbi:hypothetical protein [Streptomyces pseudogriseolus]|uniref:hypothetical protein n=1 Tax=Streptomyces pseudogriseolus TaxID=36817 RepID=UPI003FA24DC6
MSALELRFAKDTGSYDLYADGEHVGYIHWLARTEGDPEDYTEGWCGELWGSSTWYRCTENHPDIKVIVATLQDLNRERDEHEAEMKRIERNRPRTVSIPSGGQPR